MDRIMINFFSPSVSEMDLKANSNDNHLIERVYVSPMQIALSREDYSLMRFLLDNGGDLNRACCDGMFPLEYAFHHNKKELVDFLLDNGADPTIIELGCPFNIEMAKYMITKGANRNTIKIDCALWDKERALALLQLRPDLSGESFGDFDFDELLKHNVDLEKFEPLTDYLDDIGERFIFIADGATWIWRWVNEAYPNATQILDFYHAVEHLSHFAKFYYKNKDERNKWINKQKLNLLNDKIESIIKEIGNIKCSKSVDKERNKLLTYLNNNQHRMLYKTFKDRGLRIGSGAIESAHRTVIQKRMKQSGQRWSIKGAQYVIDLRQIKEFN